MNELISSVNLSDEQPVLFDKVIKYLSDGFLCFKIQSNLLSSESILGPNKTSHQIRDHQMHQLLVESLGIAKTDLPDSFGSFSNSRAGMTRRRSESMAGPGHQQWGPNSLSL